jgi:DNA-binding response OmpR family regulator
MDILLVEDDLTITRELTLRWQTRDWRVHACPTLATASHCVQHFVIDLILLDLQLPDGDGLPWIRQIRQTHRQTPVLVLTARDRVADRVLGLKSGADDYLVKPFAPEELEARIEALQRRSCLPNRQQAQCGSLVWLGDEGRAMLAGQPLELQPREFEVLGILTQRAPRLVAKRVLVDALAERNLEVGDSAVEVYISRLRRKLSNSDVTIHTVRGFGYRLASEGNSTPSPP